MQVSLGSGNANASGSITLASLRIAAFPSREEGSVMLSHLGLKRSILRHFAAVCPPLLPFSEDNAKLLPHLISSLYANH